MTMAEGESSAAVINCAESPLAWLRARKDKSGSSLISDAQFLAGERLRGDFTRAQMAPSITSVWAGPTRNGVRRRHGGRQFSEPESNDRSLDAKENFYRAIDAIGPELSKVVVDVCCYLQGLEAAEKKLNWPRRSGKIVLQLGLSALARHYGYTWAARPYGDAQHWGADDYRPHLTPPTGNDG